MPRINYALASIGGKCSIRVCQEPLYRRTFCRQHYAEWKLRTDERIAEEAQVYGVDCFVYAIRADNGLIKIGVSIQPERRYRMLLTQSPMPMKLLGYIPGSYKIEALLHALLDDSHSHGEWFHPTPEVMEAVEAIVQKDFDKLEAVLT